MKQKEKDLLIEDLCSRLPYGVTVYVEHDWFYDEVPPYACDLNVSNHTILNKFLENPLSCGLTIKPYLRPMSSMMQGEWEEMTALIYPYGRVNCNPNNKNELLLWLSAEGNNMPIMFMDNVFSWLDKNMFDYRGLILMGLAIEAPEGMYNLN